MSPASSASTCSWGVSMIPGATAFTVTPCGPSSSAAALVSEMMPAFEAEYAVARGQPVRPQSDVTFTIRPQPASVIAGAQALMHANVPVRLVLTTCQNSPAPTSSMPPITM